MPSTVTLTATVLSMLFTVSEPHSVASRSTRPSRSPLTWYATWPRLATDSVILWAPGAASMVAGVRRARSLPSSAIQAPCGWLSTTIRKCAGPSPKRASSGASGPRPPSP